MSQPVVKFEKMNKVGIVTLDRPPALNALNQQVFLALAKIFETIAADDGIKVVILTGSGNNFAAGADVKELQNLSPLGAREFALSAFRTQQLLCTLSKPTIAAINGYALGAGCEISLCCDLRVAGDNAKFGQPEINLGIIPGGGGTQRLSRLVGLARAKEIVFSGKIITAQEALIIGLVNSVVPRENTLDEAMKLAREIAGKSAPALAIAKTALNVGFDLDLNNGLQYEIECFAQSFTTQDHIEGIKAFNEKRVPEFSDR